MSLSSPADLAVAFRSLSRRLAGAPDERTPIAAIGTARAEVDAAVASVAAVMHCPATAEDVATAVHDRPADLWTDDDLAVVQSGAEAAARAIRTLANLSENS